MKQIKRLTVLLLVGLAITAHSQNLVDSLSLINGVLQPNPMRWDDLPVHELILTSESLAKPLPSAVSNDTSRFFPPIFNQTGNSCVHAAEIGYNLTYEMNRLRGVNAGSWDNHDPNLFPHLYSFNFVNGGSNVIGTPVYSGFQIVLSNGCPMYDDWYYTNGQNSMQYWMDGYEKYHRGMNNRVIGVKTITLDNYNANTCVNHLKHWIADHGDGSDVGGVAVICVYTDGWVYNSILPEQSAHSGEKVISQMGNSVGYNPPSHAMTIVGYDDNICYDINMNHKIIIYDAVPGGAGHSRRLASESGDVLKKVINRAVESLRQCDCSPSCYRCLRNYENQKVHEILDREKAIAFLERFACD